MRTRGIDLAAELLDSLPDPVIGCDTDGMIVYWSRAAEEVYGYLGAEALGRRAATLLHTRFPAPLLEIIEELDDVGRWHGRLEHRGKDGRVVTVHSHWVARHDRQGARVGSFAIERELAHEAAAPAPASEAAPASVPPGAPAHEPSRSPAPPEPTAAALAHELNNALAIIINYTGFVAAELEALDDTPAEATRASLRADLHEIETAAERAMELTRRLLT